MRQLISMLLVGGVVVLCASSAPATTIHVPADQSTIQAGIDAASNRDTVLASAGVFTENINFKGKNIRLHGSGRDLTTLRPASISQPTVTVTFGESQGTELRGFSIEGGVGYSALEVSGATISITDNTFRGFSSAVNNSAVIVISASVVDLRRNDFHNNQSRTSCVAIWSGLVQVINNTFYMNEGGFFSFDSRTVALNNIVANSDNYGIHGLFTTQDYNNTWNNTGGDYTGGAFAGLNCLSASPEFLDASAFDLRLKSTSPCIDAGDPDPLFYDPDGTRCDMGVFPYDCRNDSSDCDRDGVPNIMDNCVNDFNPTQSDLDLDSVGDVCDNCSSTSNTSQFDMDLDGVGDDCDNCPIIANASQDDVDLDGVGDTCDNCPGDFNPSQTDVDSDGLGDICDECLYDPANDADHDGVCGDIDNCPSVANSSQADADADGVGDVCDNCPARFNPAQEEADGDGIADSCDNCPTVFNASQTDVDGDGIGNACDVCLTDPLNDEDRDGVCHGVDNCPAVYNPDQVDTNSNGIGDVCDCQCPCHADPVCDSVQSDILDVINTVTVAFRGMSPTSDAFCPRERTDSDCSGSTDVLDVVKTIDVAFRGADVTNKFCQPCWP